jgi:hypothetical protein
MGNPKRFIGLLFLTNDCKESRRRPAHLSGPETESLTLAMAEGYTEVKKKARSNSSEMIKK